MQLIVLWSNCLRLDPTMSKKIKIVYKRSFSRFADAALLQRATADLQIGFSYLSYFVPSRAIVVTWSDVTLDGANSSQLVKNIL